MEWVTISKLNKGINFYPINLLGDALGKRLSYKQAYKKSEEFWNDKVVLFHFIWKGPYVADCIKLWQTIRNNAKQFWVEFDADHHMKHPHTIDFSIKRPLFLRELGKKATGFVWEFPMHYNPFINNVTRVPLRMYQRRWEKPSKKKRDIDFFIIVESRHGNGFQSISLASELSNKYNVVCSVQQPEDNTHFKKVGLNILERNATYPLHNFYKFLHRSKVVIDITPRFTAGRIIYDSLFAGCLSICSSSMGASEYLFPDLVVNPFFTDLSLMYELCETTIERWSPKVVKEYQNRACSIAGLNSTVKELNEKAKQI